MKNFYTLLLSALFLPFQLHAERPMLVDDPDVVPAGKFMIEYGNHFDILRSADRPAQYVNWFDLLLGYGIRNNVEVTLHIPSSLTLYDNSAPEQVRFHTNLLSISGKFVNRSKNDRLAAGIEGSLFVPVLRYGDTSGSESVAVWANIMGDAKFGRLILRGSAGIMRTFDFDPYRAAFLGAAVRSDTRPYFLFGEIFTEIPLQSNGRLNPTSIQLGGGYEISEYTILDAGIARGLNEGTAKMRAAVGITLIF